MTPTSQDVIEALKGLLEQAYDGSLIALTCVGSFRSGDTVTYEAGTPNVAQHVFALEDARLQLMGRRRA
jgi:hypothetical protein